MAYCSCCLFAAFLYVIDESNDAGLPKKIALLYSYIANAAEIVTETAFCVFSNCTGMMQSPAGWWATLFLLVATISTFAAQRELTSTGI